MKGDVRSPPALQAVRAAFVFLTRLPVGGFPFAPADFRRAAACFPLVGALLGVVLAGVWLCFVRAGALADAAVVVAVGLLLTGAFHEDGLADTADALGGARSRERAFAILKDSRIGAFGAAALFSVLMLRVLLLARLAPIAPATLIATQCAARAPPVWLLAALPYVTPESSDARAKSAAVAKAGLPQAVIATLWPIAFLAALVSVRALCPSHVIAVAVAGAASSLICGWRFHARLGGVTGDLLGAAEQFSECAMLLAIALVAEQPD